MQKLAENSVGVGMIGAGWMGSVQLRRLKERDDARVEVLCTRDAARGRALLDELGLTGVRVVTDFEEMLADPAVEAVFLVNVNKFHGPQSIEALEAGKHVFCEKPPSTTFEDHCRQVDLAASRPDLVTYVNYVLYFDRFEERLRRMVADGRSAR